MSDHIEHRPAAVDDDRAGDLGTDPSAPPSAKRKVMLPTVEKIPVNRLNPPGRGEKKVDPTSCGKGASRVGRPFLSCDCAAPATCRYSVVDLFAEQSKIGEIGGRFTGASNGLVSWQFSPSVNNVPMDSCLDRMNESEYRFLRLDTLYATGSPK
jgi:hypothetical protein